MGKAEEAIVGATEPQPHFPVVAEGTGKTAGNEGATSKEVYNVRFVPAGRQGTG